MHSLIAKMLCISYLLVHLSNHTQTLLAKILIFRWSALKIEPSGIARESKTIIPENKSIISFLFLIEKTNSASPSATLEILFVQVEIQLSRKNYCRVHICGYWNLSLMKIQVAEKGAKFSNWISNLIIGYFNSGEDFRLTGNILSLIWPSLSFWILRS